MAWLFSCFRCKQKRQCRSSSPRANYKIALENAVPRNANVLETQGVVQDERVHSCASLEKRLDDSKLGNDVDRSLLSLLRTETTKKQSSDNSLQKDGLQQEFRRVKDEATDLKDSLDPQNNLRRDLDDLHVDSEEGQEEKGRHMARLHSLLTKLECEGKTLVMDKLMLQEQNRLDCDNGVEMGEPLLSSTKNESQLCGIEASKELCNFPLSVSPATQNASRLSLDKESDLISPERTLLERTFQNWRGCLSETKVKQPEQRRDDSFESTPQNIEEPLKISRLKRSSKALSFSEFSLELEELKRTESAVTRRTIGINRITALKGGTDDEITRNLCTNVSGSLPMSSEQAISLSVPQDVAFYDTDIEVNSKAVTPYSNENSHGSSQGYVQTFKYNAHEVPSCADLTMEQSQAFTFEDGYNKNSEVFSQFFTECNSKRKVLDEEVEELDIDQMSNCSDASSVLTSPLPHILSERDEVFVRKRAHLQQATPRAFPMLQESTAADCGKSRFNRELSFASTETSGGWMKMQSHESLNLDTQLSFEETNSKDINLPGESRQLSANIAADLVSGDTLLSSKFSDDVTSRPSRRSINLSPESCACSSTDHMKALTCNEFDSPEVASFSVPSPETVTSIVHMHSPLPLVGAKEASSTRRIMLNLPQETPSVSKSVLEISSTNLMMQQPTPRTPSASSSQVETPNSIQSAVSPADLAKDRPIMGTVAAHWSHSSSKEKWWDGKGIPNSTNKYKEDQKVSWHATPFEVRVERALAKQGRVFQKKLFGGAMPTEMERRTKPITSSG